MSEIDHSEDLPGPRAGGILQADAHGLIAVYEDVAAGVDDDLVESGSTEPAGELIGQEALACGAHVHQEGRTEHQLVAGVAGGLRPRGPAVGGAQAPGGAVADGEGVSRVVAELEQVGAHQGVHRPAGGPVETVVEVQQVPRARGQVQHDRAPPASRHRAPGGRTPTTRTTAPSTRP